MAHVKGSSSGRSSLAGSPRHAGRLARFFWDIARAAASVPTLAGSATFLAAVIAGQVLADRAGRSRSARHHPRVKTGPVPAAYGQLGGPGAASAANRAFA